MNLGDSIRSGTGWLMSGRVVIQFLQFAFGIVLARLLMPQDFGLLVTMSIFTGLASFFAGGGMGQALIQAKHVEDKHYHVVFTLQLMAGFLVYIFFFIISPWFAVWFDNTLYENLLRVSALTFIMRPLANINNAKLNRDMRFKEQSLIQLCSSIVSGVCSVIMAFSGWGVWSLIYSGIIGSSLNIFLLFLVAGQKPIICFDMDIAKNLGIYGIKVTVNDIISYFSKQISNLIISKSLGPAKVGIFNKAFSLRSIPDNIILASAYQTVFRALSKVQDDRSKSQYIFFRSITLLAVYTWPVYIGFWWIADPLINFLYGSKWIAAAEPLKILSLIGLLYCIGYQSGAVIAAQNKLGRELIIQVEKMVYLGVGCYIGMRWGLSGVAWAMYPVHFYTTVRTFRLANSCIGTSFYDLWLSLKPAIILNIILSAGLFLFDMLFNHFLNFSSDFIYLGYMVFGGVLIYVISFLYLPIKSLSTEADRWKKYLKLKVKSIA